MPLSTQYVLCTMNMDVLYDVSTQNILYDTTGHDAFKYDENNENMPLNTSELQLLLLTTTIFTSEHL
jgi:hypothetical protein